MNEQNKIKKQKTPKFDEKSDIPIHEFYTEEEPIVNSLLDKKRRKSF